MTTPQPKRRSTGRKLLLIPFAVLTLGVIGGAGYGIVQTFVDPPAPPPLTNDDLKRGEDFLMGRGDNVQQLEQQKEELAQELEEVAPDGTEVYQPGE